MSIPVVTVDGPSGAGKGTLAQMLAQKLGFHFLDSGALYRLTALAAQRSGVEWADEAAVANVASEMDVVFEPTDSGVNIVLDGVISTSDIRQEAISKGASIVAAHPAVRQALLQVQVNFQKAPGLVADGRDMGTVVFPNAEAKIFLTASAEARAERRYQQLVGAKLLEPGDSGSLRALLADIQARDARDSQRATSPLKPAEDALMLDSTELGIDEVLNAAMEFLHKKGVQAAKR